MNAPQIALPALVLSILLSACGDDTGPSDTSRPDGATDADAGPDGDTTMMPPEIPWLADGVPPVTLTPCPDGWREVSGGDVTECDPYPESGPVSCGPGEAHFPGGAGCEPVGDACPAGTFADALPSSGGIVYVDASAPSGGDGSLAQPFTSLSDVAWASLGVGTTVGLARGTYDGLLLLKGGVQVMGACAAETILSGSDLPVRSVVTVTTAGETAMLSNLSIVDTTQYGAFVERGRSLAIDGVVFERTTGFGVLVVDGSEVNITDVVIRGNRSNAEGRFGPGLSVELRSQVQATRMIIESNTSAGVLVSGDGTELTLSDVVIRGTLPDPEGLGGVGLQVSGGRAVVTRALIADNRFAGIFSRGEGTEVVLTDSVVRDTQVGAVDGEGGWGISVAEGRFEGTRVVSAGNTEVGLRGELGAALVLNDVVVRDTQRTASFGTWGVVAQMESRIEANRLLVGENHRQGIVAFDASSLTLTDVAVLNDGERWGAAVGASNGSDLMASRLLVSGKHFFGVLLIDSRTSGDVSDVVISDTEARAIGEPGGAGIMTEGSASLTGARIVADGLAGYGAMAIDRGSIEVTDFSVTGVEATCTVLDCTDSFGYGVAAPSGTIRLTRFAIRDAATCGVLVARSSGSTTDPEVDLAYGVVSGAPIGACAPAPGYDLERLTTNVEYRDNGENISTEPQPIPEGLP